MPMKAISFYFFFFFFIVFAFILFFKSSFCESYLVIYWITVFTRKSAYAQKSAPLELAPPFENQKIMSASLELAPLYFR